MGRTVLVPGRLDTAPSYTSTVAEPAPTTVSEDSPPIDPDAVDRAYRLHRARRAARKQRYREKRWAGVRFWLVLVLVVAAAVIVGLRTLGEIERVFGL
jgi:hypothetical protein